MQTPCKVQLKDGSVGYLVRQHSDDKYGFQPSLINSDSWVQECVVDEGDIEKTIEFNLVILGETISLKSFLRQDQYSDDWWKRASSNFDKVVDRFASDLGMSFFCDSGDGRDMVLPEMYCEDIDGWLIPADQTSAFEEEWEKRYGSSNSFREKWEEYTCFAQWHINLEDELEVLFYHQDPPYYIPRLIH